MFHSTLSSRRKLKNILPEITNIILKQMEAPPAVKVKKPRTEAQKAVTEKGFAALKARREAIAKAKAEGTEYVPPPKVEPPPEVVVERILTSRRTKKAPSQVSIVSKELAEVKEMLVKQMKPVEIEKIVEKEVVREVPVDRVVEREKVLSGSALLDRLFFNK
jgi:hypothetical protein